jgi:hypothetical protein
MMTTNPRPEEGSVFRIGSVAGIIGSLLAMVGNLLHPATYRPATWRSIGRRMERRVGLDPSPDASGRARASTLARPDPAPWRGL